jgi:RNA polymerase sigma-70 factor (ECF subfamily)
LAGWNAFIGAIPQACIMLKGDELQRPHTATTVQVRDGVRRVEDEPFVDTKEQPGGYVVVELLDLDAARLDGEGRLVPLDRQDPRLWDGAMISEAEGRLIRAARAHRYERFQCEAAIQSVHAARAVTGRTDRGALRTLCDLPVARSGGIGARIGRAVAIAEAGAPEEGMAALDALPAAGVAGHQSFWVARGRIAELAGQRPEAKVAPRRRPDPRGPVRRFLSERAALT